MITSRKCKAGIDSDILPLLEKENKDVVTDGTDSDECSDETVSGIEESGKNGGGGDYYDEGNIVQATQQIARPNLRNLKQVLCKPTGKCKFTGE